MVSTWITIKVGELELQIVLKCCGYIYPCVLWKWSKYSGIKRIIFDVLICSINISKSNGVVKIVTKQKLKLTKHWHLLIVPTHRIFPRLQRGRLLPADIFAPVSVLEMSWWHGPAAGSMLGLGLLLGLGVAVTVATLAQGLARSCWTSSTAVAEFLF